MHPSWVFLTKTAKGQFVLKPGSGSASKANTKLILAEEDNIQHILASLALKATRQSVIIAKLNSYPRKNRTKKELWELDNLRRSLHQLNYVDSPQFQRNIQRALNRASPITNWCARSRMPTAANCESEPIRSNSSGANARGCWPTASSPIGIARARRAPAGLPTGRRDQASEPGKLETCEPLRGRRLPGYRRWGRPPGIDQSLGRQPAVGVPRRRTEVAIF